jgi:electron transfer flavoprotein beta subunit
MNIVVLIKQVPDTWSERTLSDGDKTLDRASSDAVLDEINERAVEEALKIKEAGDAEVTILTAGPDRATDAIRKALSMGADKAIHVSDDALHGSDLLATAKVIAAAIRRIEGVDLVIAGNEASDGRGGAVPAVVAEMLGLPQLTHARQLTVDGSTVKVDRETADEGLTRLEASLPALVSVTEKINEPRYPSFKGIMAAKSKPVETLTVADLGVDAGAVGAAGARQEITDVSAADARQAGEIVVDEGDGADRIIQFLEKLKVL